MMFNPTPADYPNLLRPVFWEWGPIQADFAVSDQPPPEALVSNINVIPFVGDEWLIIRLTNGNWEMTGGTREPGEHYLATARRELLEEAGAQLLSFQPFGAWKCRSEAAQPYRPHLPHPDFYRLVGYGAIRLTDTPLNPTGAEQVASVELVPLTEAARRFRSIDRHDLAELYLLAAAARAAWDSTA
jgi:8-oxo-dGTP pyrophosphatase MutT (NUDIX family)